jgi:hypothetical protein
MKSIFSLFLLILLAACQPDPEFDLAVQNVSIIDVENGELIENQTVYIRGGVIERIENSDREFNADETIDGSGRYLMPGLWDMHVHFRGGEDLIDENKNLLPLYIAHGVTTVRDAGGDITPAILKWRDAIRNGELTGPDIFTSGPKIDGPGYRWPGSIAVESVDDIHAALDSLEQIGADFVKVNDSALDSELFLPAIRAASDRGLPVTGHMPFDVIFPESVEAGLTATEHIFYAFKGTSPDETAITREMIERRGTDNPLGFLDALLRISETQDEQHAAELFEMMRDQQAGIIPTLHIMDVLAGLRENDHTQDEFLSYIGPGIQETYRGRYEQALRAPADQQSIYDIPGFRETVKWMNEHGVAIYAGSDAGPFNSFVYPGESLHDELAALVDAGLSPADALRAATVDAAGFFGKEDQRGIIREGAAADLILLDANPLEDIRNTRGVSAVITHAGRVYLQDDLERLLDDVADIYRR